MDTVIPTTSLPHLIFKSIGIKNHLVDYAPAGKGKKNTYEAYCLPKADIYLDCRSIKEPEAPGASVQAAQAILACARSSDQWLMFRDQVISTVNHFIPLRRSTEVDPYKRPIVVMCMCAHGVNRSVATKHYLAKVVSLLGWNTEVA